jgi:hypothetical protein
MNSNWWGASGDVEHSKFRGLGARKLKWIGNIAPPVIGIGHGRCRVAYSTAISVVTVSGQYSGGEWSVRKP